LILSENLPAMTIGAFFDSLLENAEGAPQPRKFGAGIAAKNT
jgi:hypothetical protein